MPATLLCATLAAAALAGAPGTPALAAGESAPRIITVLSGNLGTSTALLMGTANTGGLDGTFQFSYGTSANYGQSTPPAPLSGSAADSPLWAELSGLQPASTYHYSLRVSTAAGAVSSADMTFNTASPPVAALAPSITSMSAGVDSSSSGMLSALVNANGSPSSYQFSYGTSAAYGQSTPTALTYGTVPGPISARLRGLSASSTYHYRLTISNVAGTSTTPDKTFRTPAAIPVFANLNLKINVGAKALGLTMGCQSAAVCQVRVSLQSANRRPAGPTLTRTIPAGRSSTVTLKYSAAIRRSRHVRLVLLFKRGERWLSVVRGGVSIPAR